MNFGPIKLQILAFVSSLLASLILTYVVRNRAARLRLFDPTDERKLHTRQIPRVGGIAIVGAVFLSIALLVSLAGFEGSNITGRKLLTILIGGAATHLLGLYDDLRQMRARYKFAVQIAIAAGIFVAGVHIDTVSLPFVGIVELGRVAGLLFTIFWFVGLTNAFNLIDGLDGLASGAAMFALTTMFVVATMNGQAGAALVTIALAGATLGFLRYNFHPASIFLGDSGSLFLGFMLAGIGAISSQKGSTVVAIAIPLVSLGLPVLDTSLAIIRRFLRGQPIFSADRGHIHHRLLSFGHSPRKVALLMYGGCALLALGGMLLVNSSGYVAIVLLLVGLGVGVVIQHLRYHEFDEVVRLIRRGARQRRVIGRNVSLREACTRVSESQSVAGVFETMERAFVDSFERAEIRLRPSFVARGMKGAPDRRFDDDVLVWSWKRAAPRNGAWEVRVPMHGPRGERIGSLLVWQDGTAVDPSLSHLNVVTRDLRAVVERQLWALWPQDGLADGPLGGSGVARDVPVERVVAFRTRETAARRADDVALVAEINARERTDERSRVS